ncbi:MAG: ankyrin repeat domain-containing protein, partial [Hyphomicrobiaceae bacterium]
MQATDMIILETQHRSRPLILLLLVAFFAYDASAAPTTQFVIGTKESRAGQRLWLVQLSPENGELERYTGLHAAAAKADIGSIKRLISAGASLESRDHHGRTPLMVASYKRNHATAKALINAGASLDALDNDRYDLLTIAAVLNDLAMVRLAIAAGANTRLITSPYEGTALIAAAHLGHVEVVRALIGGNAPLDHVNNLGWTALIEAIVLGDGGPRHIAIVRALIDAGADPNLPDKNGNTPLALAHQHHHEAIVEILRR